MANPKLKPFDDSTPFLYLRWLRIKRGYSKRELTTRANMPGFHSYQLTLVEEGRLRPTEEWLDGLARALVVSPPSILLRPVTVRLPEIDTAAMAVTA